MGLRPPRGELQRQHVIHQVIEILVGQLLDRGGMVAVRAVLALGETSFTWCSGRRACRGRSASTRSSVGRVEVALAVVLALAVHVVHLSGRCRAARDGTWRSRPVVEEEPCPARPPGLSLPSTR